MKKIAKVTTSGQPLFTDRDEEYMSVLLSVAKKWRGEHPSGAKEGLRVMASALVGLSVQEGDSNVGLPQDEKITEVVGQMIAKVEEDNVSDALEFLNQNI